MYITPCQASLLASAGSVIGLGSDICGSLRLPAHFCGVWGHKPSPRTVSLAGHYPDCEDKEAWNSYFALGPMARYAVDLPVVLDAIVKPEYKEVLRLKEEVRETVPKRNILGLEMNFRRQFLLVDENSRDHLYSIILP